MTAPHCAVQMSAADVPWRLVKVRRSARCASTFRSRGSSGAIVREQASSVTSSLVEAVTGLLLGAVVATLGWRYEAPSGG